MRKVNSQRAGNTTSADSEQHQSGERLINTTPWPIKEISGVTLVFSPLLSQHKGLIHAFTTRLGGSSPEPLHSFNLSLTRNVEGSKTDAIENRRKLCKSLNLDPDKLIVPKQTHSSKVQWVENPRLSTSADGLATTLTDTPLLLQFADCVPVILYDTKHNAVAVIHAGWRGTAAGIVKSGLKILLNKTGSTPNDVIAAVGPSIGSCCYPTGHEVLEGLASSVKNLDGLIRYVDDIPHPDLKAINALQLQESHVPRIDICSFCTGCTPELFYSHRKFQGRTGHQGAIAALVKTLVALFFLVMPASTPASQQQSDDQGRKQAAQKVHLVPLQPKLGKQEDSTSDVSSGDLEQTIGHLENIIFGAARTEKTIADRLSALELAVFHQVFESDPDTQRVNKLALLLEGSRTAAPVPEAGTSTKQADLTDYEHDPAYLKELPPEQLYQFALHTINEEREAQGMRPLQWDESALKAAQEHTRDLVRRATTSHFNEAGDNPDLRYTKIGGTDALTESIVSIACDVRTGNNKTTVVRILKAINSQQDDRDAIFSPDATHFGFAYGTESGGNHIIACAETVTRHSIMHSIPKQLQPGEKIEIRGVLMEPYHFQRITLAWEGLDADNPADKEQVDAAPYFPPLDYVAYAQKAQRGEHERAANILRTAGIVAALAGGMFIPPVAFAAPLIAMSGAFPSTSEPHAVSEIPVHGGIKVIQNLFYGSILISHQNKAGLYYVTVWANTGEGHHTVPVSRRVIIARLDDSIKINTREDTHTIQALK